MKNFKSLSSIVAIATLTSQIASADPVILSEDLDLIGFSGGSCNITVNANSAAGSLDLDTPPGRVQVGTVNTQCDYAYRVTVTSNTTDPVGNYALLNREDSNIFVNYIPLVDGIVVPPKPNFEINSFLPGDNREMPVEIDLVNGATSPGIYTGSLTFSVIVD